MGRPVGFKIFSLYSFDWGFEGVFCLFAMNPPKFYFMDLEVTLDSPLCSFTTARDCVPQIALVLNISWLFVLVSIVHPPFLTSFFEFYDLILSGLPFSSLTFTGLFPICVLGRSVMSNSFFFLYMSNSLWPHGRQPSRLLYPWNFPGKNTGVGCHFLHQGIFPPTGIEPMSFPSPALAGRFFYL